MHLHGTTYQVERVEVRVTAFDVVERLGKRDGLVVPEDLDAVCPDCGRHVRRDCNRFEEAPGDPTDDAWRCAWCERERLVEQRRAANHSLDEYSR